MTFRAGALLACVLIGASLPAQKTPEGWRAVPSDVDAGLSVFTYASDQPLQAWVIVADLADGRLACRPVVSEAAGGKEPLSALAKSGGALAAINASPFDLKAEPCRADGWLVVAGKGLGLPTAFTERRGKRYPVARAAAVWSQGTVPSFGWFREENGRAVRYDRPIANRSMKPAVLPPGRERGTPAEAVTHAVEAGPMLVRRGKADVTREEEVLFAGRDDRLARSAIGVAGKRVLLMVVDARSDKSKGATLVQLARLLEDWGADDAINLDGGGSSTLVLGGRVLNHPLGHGQERPVPTAIGVFLEKPDSRPSDERR